MVLSPRNRRLTASLNLAGAGLEYGPLNRAILSKDDYKVQYVDYADRDTLVKHYAEHKNVDTSRIPEIDIVTRGQLISEMIAPNSIDFILASHVWEHVPDFLGWLESNLIVLKSGGRLAVAYPDKRYTLDMKRRSSMLSDILAAYIEKRTQPTLSQVSDHFCNVVATTPQDAWAGVVTPTTAKPVHSTESVIRLLQRLRSESRYVDCHCWVFEDREFLHIVEQVSTYITSKFQMVSFFPTTFNSNECYITIEKLQSAP